MQRSGVVLAGNVRTIIKLHQGNFLVAQHLQQGRIDQPAIDIAQLVAEIAQQDTAVEAAGDIVIGVANALAQIVLGLFRWL